MKKNIVFILITILILVSTFFISIKYIDSINNNVEDNYKIVFRGETIDNIYSTYVYKKVKYQMTVLFLQNSLSAFSKYHYLWY